MTRQLQIARVGNRVILTVTETDDEVAEKRYREICACSPLWVGQFLPKQPQDKCRVEAREGCVVMSVET